MSTVDNETVGKVSLRTFFKISEFVSLVSIEGYRNKKSVDFYQNDFSDNLNTHIKGDLS